VEPLPEWGFTIKTVLLESNTVSLLPVILPVNIQGALARLFIKSE
jgi:hypothetical protein